MPQTKIAASVDGEVNFSGRAKILEEDGETVQATHPGTKCLYFYYTLEREERDSDGDKRWVTVKTDKRFRSV